MNPPAHQSKCSYCLLAIEPNAKVCTKCGRSKGIVGWLEHIGSVALLLSVISTGIAVGQALSARSARIAAQAAAEESMTTQSELQALALDVAEATWLQSQNANRFGGHAATKVRIEDTLDTLLLRAIPDEEERADWKAEHLVQPEPIPEEGEE